MDGRQFDAVTRVLGREATRRSALGLLGGLAAARLGFASAKDKDRKSHKSRGQTGKPRANQGAVSAQAVNCSSLGHGSNVNGCNFNGDDLAGEDFSSSSMVGTKFNNANLCGTDLSSSQLRNAEFKGANLTRADLSSSGCKGTLFNDATVFCQTKMCDGKMRNDDCPAEGQVCCADANCGPGKACQGNTCCVTNLAAAIAAASPGDTIRMCSGTFHTVNATINKNLTIIGTGSGTNPAADTILDAEQDGRVLVVASGASVEIRNLRITGGLQEGGSVPEIGGGIRNTGALTLLGVSVTGNKDSGISNSGVLFLGADTFVTGNTSAYAGGGIVNGSAGVLTLRGNSHVDNNTQTRTDSAGGGGILSVGSLTMEPGSTVSNNTAGSWGGGIRITEGTATLQAGSVVTGNKAQTGGGIQSVGGPVTIAATNIVTGNTPNNCSPAIANCIG